MWSNFLLYHVHLNDTQKINNKIATLLKVMLLPNEHHDTINIMIQLINIMTIHSMTQWISWSLSIEQQVSSFDGLNFRELLHFVHGAVIKQKPLVVVVIESISSVVSSTQTTHVILQTAVSWTHLMLKGSYRNSIEIIDSWIFF